MSELLFNVRTNLETGDTKDGVTNIAAAGIKTLTVRVTIKHAINWAAPYPYVL